MIAAGLDTSDCRGRCGSTVQSLCSSGYLFTQSRAIRPHLTTICAASVHFLACTGFMGFTRPTWSTGSNPNAHLSSRASTNQVRSTPLRVHTPRMHASQAREATVGQVVPKRAWRRRPCPRLVLPRRETLYGLKCRNALNERRPRMANEMTIGWPWKTPKDPPPHWLLGR